MISVQYTHKFKQFIQSLPDKQVAWLSNDTDNTSKTQSLGESGGKKKAKSIDNEPVMDKCLFMV